MALVAITGNILDTNGSLPDASSGSTLQFLLNGPIRRSDGYLIVPNVETASLNETTGAFSIALQSTRDATPSTRYYTVMLRGIFDGKKINTEIGRIQIPSTPASQVLSDLWVDALVAETSGRHYRETPTGTVNGANTDFYLTYAPISGTEMVFLNEDWQVPTDAYSIDSSGKITFVLAPILTDRVRVIYQIA